MHHLSRRALPCETPHPNGARVECDTDRAHSWRYSRLKISHTMRSISITISGRRSPSVAARLLWAIQDVQNALDINRHPRIHQMNLSSYMMSTEICSRRSALRQTTSHGCLSITVTEQGGLTTTFRPLVRRAPPMLQYCTQGRRSTLNIMMHPCPQRNDNALPR